MTTPVSRAVLVTGCSTGIGRATAERLARGGWPVFASARRVEAIRDLEGAGCRCLALDVCDEGSMRAALEAIEKQHGAVGALVNNAGYGSEGPIEEIAMEEVRRQFETNVFGLLRLTQLVLPGMRRQRWGRIVNLSSMGGRMTLPGGGVYHATKYAVEALSDALRFEVRGFGIGVSIVEPGLIKTEFATAAERSIDEGTAKDGPYATFNRQVAEKTVEAYEGPMARLAAGPDAVAKVIERAIDSSRPKPRYLVTAGARVLLVTRRALPDRGWDAMMRAQYPSPKP